MTSYDRDGTVTHPTVTFSVPAVVAPRDVFHNTIACGNAGPRRYRQRFNRDYSLMAIGGSTAGQNAAVGVVDAAGTVRMFPAPAGGFRAPVSDGSPSFNPVTGRLWYATTEYGADGSSASYASLDATAGAGTRQREAAAGTPSNDYTFGDTGDVEQDVESRDGSLRASTDMYDLVVSRRSGARRVVATSSSCFFPRAWLDDHRIACVDVRESRIVVATLDAGLTKVVAEEPLFPASGRSVDDVVVSPDGRWIAFSSTGDIFAVPADGSAPPTRVVEGPATPAEWV